MKRWVVVLAATALAAPAPAFAAFVERYRVRDAGDRIVHTINWCVQRHDVRAGYETRVRFQTRHENDDGRDRQFLHFSDWYGRGCWTTRLSYRDLLRYKGQYWGRVRISIAGQVIHTPWRGFWSS